MTKKANKVKEGTAESATATTTVELTRDLDQQERETQNREKLLTLIEGAVRLGFATIPMHDYHAQPGDDLMNCDELPFFDASDLVEVLDILSYDVLERTGISVFGEDESSAALTSKVDDIMAIMQQAYTSASVEIPSDLSADAVSFSSNSEVISNRSAIDDDLEDIEDIEMLREIPGMELVQQATDGLMPHYRFPTTWHPTGKVFCMFGTAFSDRLAELRREFPTSETSYMSKAFEALVKYVEAVGEVQCLMAEYLYLEGDFNPQEFEEALEEAAKLLVLYVDTYPSPSSSPVFAGKQMEYNLDFTPPTHVEYMHELDAEVAMLSVLANELLGKGYAAFKYQPERGGSAYANFHGLIEKSFAIMNDMLAHCGISLSFAIHFKGTATQERFVGE